MNNAFFTVTVDSTSGCISSIRMPDDEYGMNWCANDGLWGRLHDSPVRSQEFHLISCTDTPDFAESVYTGKTLSVHIRRSFTENGNFTEKCVITNISPTVVCVNRDNFGIEFPFNDRYTNADECMVGHCHTHIWCGHDTTWINALRMGESEQNLGLVLTEGSIDCYTQDGCKSNVRGVFILNPTGVFLKSGESYTLAWEVFRHKGKSDFRQKLSAYPHAIDIRAEHYTVFLGETFRLTIRGSQKPTVFCHDEELTVTGENGVYHVDYTPTVIGEYRLEVKYGMYATWAELLVKIPFAELLEKRVRFIVRRQQCLDPESPLYGAFLVYDNDYDSMYFDYANPDHNACRERMNIPFLLMKYLQTHEDSEVRNAMKLYSQFIVREFFDVDTGEVFNTIGKNRDQLRLYNAPGVMLVFTEMYFITQDTTYLKYNLKLAENYYGIGGKKCYANGLAIGKVMKAFRMAGMEEEGRQMLAYFHTHVDNIIGNGTSYPKHEVNYEQTIVTPAVTHISEMGLLCEDKDYYIREAKKHLACLERFSGEQPSYHLNEIAIRYWDDYWFGKNRTFGDTLPHHLSCLTARSYLAYAKLTGETEWAAKAEECIRNCMCLIGDNGRGSAACVYPYRLDGRRGGFFDPWSNDQDLVLYDALYFDDYRKDTF